MRAWPETVIEAHGVKCPKCNDDDQLDVYATLAVRLTCDGTDVFASSNGDHAWGDGSLIECYACDHRGTVKEFRVKPD